MVSQALWPLLLPLQCPVVSWEKREASHWTGDSSFSREPRPQPSTVYVRPAPQDGQSVAPHTLMHRLPVPWLSGVQPYPGAGSGNEGPAREPCPLPPPQKEELLPPASV